MVFQEMKCTDGWDIVDELDELTRSRAEETSSPAHMNANVAQLLNVVNVTEARDGTLYVVDRFKQEEVLIVVPGFLVEVLLPRAAGLKRFVAEPHLSCLRIDRDGGQAYSK